MLKYEGFFLFFQISDLDLVRPPASMTSIDLKGPRAAELNLDLWGPNLQCQMQTRWGPNLYKPWSSLLKKWREKSFETLRSPVVSETLIISLIRLCLNPAKYFSACKYSLNWILSKIVSASTLVNPAEMWIYRKLCIYRGKLKDKCSNIRTVTSATWTSQGNEDQEIKILRSRHKI